MRINDFFICKKSYSKYFFKTLGVIEGNYIIFGILINEIRSTARMYPPTLDTTSNDIKQYNIYIFIQIVNNIKELVLFHIIS